MISSEYAVDPYESSASYYADKRKEKVLNTLIVWRHQPSQIQSARYLR